MRIQALAVFLLVLALRLPFLNQAVGGDDIYYLYGAEHAQIDPAHPNHARYPFLGQVVDMRGHPHPPLDAWFLGLLLACFGDVREIPFHAVYLLFSLIAAGSALAIARRFTTQPLAATLLFLVTPAFAVNGNSFEADVPFVAFWLLSIALFIRAVDSRSGTFLAAAIAAMALASLTAYQAVVLTPILALYCWKKARNWRAAWLSAMTPVAVILAWQLYERLTSGALPAAVLAGYMQTYGLLAFTQKLKNAGALTVHLGWGVFPALIWIAGRKWWPVLALGMPFAFLDPNPLFWLSLGTGLLVLFWCIRQVKEFLAAWVLMFFGAALILFFAGSARYLLPLVLPLAILVSRSVRPRWLYIGAGCELALSLGLAVVNYRHWDGYRVFARSMAAEAGSKRVWINGEWGLRYYLESEGALPLLQGEAVHPGEVVVTSALGYPISFTTGGGVLVPVAERVIQPAIPLRLVALNGKSAYSTTFAGLRPFDVSTAPIDKIRAEIVKEQKPALEDLSMDAPAAARQIVSGIYDAEGGGWRWMSGEGTVLLKAPVRPSRVRVSFFIPDQAPARAVRVFLDGREVAAQTYAAPGSYSLISGPLGTTGSAPVIKVTVDKTFSVAGDHRELGIILTKLGFVP